MYAADHPSGIGVREFCEPTLITHVPWCSYILLLLRPVFSLSPLVFHVSSSTLCVKYTVGIRHLPHFAIECHQDSTNAFVTPSYLHLSGWRRGYILRSSSLSGILLRGNNSNEIKPQWPSVGGSWQVMKTGTDLPSDSDALTVSNQSDSVC